MRASLTSPGGITAPPVDAHTDRTRLHVVPDAVAMPSSTWPHPVFVAWLDRLKQSLGVSSDKALGEMVDISPSLINGWRQGRSQPDIRNLRKLAQAADVAPVRVYALAGRLLDDDLEDEATGSITPLPRQIKDLLDLYEGLDADGREVLLGQVEFLVRVMTGGAKRRR